MKIIKKTNKIFFISGQSKLYAKLLSMKIQMLSLSENLKMRLVACDPYLKLKALKWKRVSLKLKF